MKPFPILLAAALFSGCATSSMVEQAEGQGMIVEWQAAPDAVFKAALTVTAGHLSIVKSDPAAGVIIARRGVTATTWGERVAIFIRPKGTATSMEVINRYVGGVDLTPMDWKDVIFENTAALLGQPLPKPIRADGRDLSSPPPGPKRGS